MNLTTTLRARRAFTLIEVLIGTVIIALGVLGLAGLFAGSARQQQLSADTTRSITITQNAAAMCVVNFGNAETDPGVTGPIPGVWYPVSMHPTEGYLTVDPQQNGQRFFREITDQTLPAVLYARNLTDLSPALMGVPGFNNPAAALPPYQNLMQTLSRRRVIGESIVCRVTFARAIRECGNIITGFDPAGGGEVVYTEPLLQGYPVPAGVSAGPNVAVLYPNGVVPDPIDDYIVVDLQNLPVDGTVAPQILAMNFPKVLELESYPCVPSGSEMALAYTVNTIVFETYDVKTDRLVSLNDRLFGSLDGAIDDSERPAMGYSLMYRESTGSVAQLMVATYALAAPSRAATYRPREREQDFSSINSTLRRTQDRARLRYDNVTDRFYVLVGPKDGYLAEPGQLIMFEGTATAPGSDFAVRVIRNERLANGDIRADLDREPVGGGVPLIINRNGVTQLYAWGVNSDLPSLSDNSRWRLRPIEMRVFQATSN